MNAKKYLYVSTIFVLVLQGCKGTHDSMTLLDQGLIAQLDYKTVKAQVIDAYCLQCHSAAGGNRGGINLETYAKVRQKLAAIQTAVSTDYMPPRPMPALAKQILLDWIAAGAPETTPTPDPAPNPSPNPTPNPSPNPTPNPSPNPTPNPDDNGNCLGKTFQIGRAGLHRHDEGGNHNEDENECENEDENENESENENEDDNENSDDRG